MRIIIVILFGITLLGCESQKPEPYKNVDSLKLIDTPDQVAWNVDINFIDSNYTRAILKARRARVYNSRFETYLDSGMTLQILSKYTGKRISLLTADSARIDDRTKNMVAKGKVVVIGDSTHTTLETSILEWNNLTQKLYSDAYVKITKFPTEIIEGYGFESDPNLTNYKIFKVKGVQQPR